jgi:hypothetical protein
MYIFEYTQVYPPGTFVTAMAAPQVEKVIVPWGWKRLLLNGAIVYFRWEFLSYVRYRYGTRYRYHLIFL